MFKFEMGKTAFCNKIQFYFKMTLKLSHVMLTKLGK